MNTHSALMTDQAVAANAAAAFGENVPLAELATVKGSIAAVAGEVARGYLMTSQLEQNGTIVSLQMATAVKAAMLDFGAST